MGGICDCQALLESSCQAKTIRILKVLRQFPELALIVNSAFFPSANNIFKDKIFQWKVFDLFDIDFICMQTNSDVSLPSLPAK